MGKNQLLLSFWYLSTGNLQRPQSENRSCVSCFEFFRPLVMDLCRDAPDGTVFNSKQSVSLLYYSFASAIFHQKHEAQAWVM